MSSQNRISDYRIFGAQPWSTSTHVDQAERLSQGSGRPLQFLVKRESSLVGLGRSLAVLFTRVNVQTLHPIYFFRDPRVSQFKLRGRSFIGSVMVHGSLILLLVNLPSFTPTQEFARDEERPLDEVIYFRVPLVEPSPAPHASEPKTPAPAPAKAADSPPVERPAPEPKSTASYGDLTIVSKPSRPDNFHQTIIQPLSAPDVKITTDVKVPNIVVMLGKAPDVPKPAFALNPSDARPTQANRQTAAVDAPTLSASQPNAALPVLAQRTVQPQLAIPAAPLSAPTAKQKSDSGQSASPGDPMLGSPASSYGLVAIGVNPADPSADVVLPPGNRSGEFTISPAAGGTGPSTVVAAAPLTASSANLANTVSSSGTSNGPDSRVAAGTLSISGPSTSGEGQGILGAALGASVVFPVPADFLSKIRKNQLVVSTGPMGGGGLDLYGAMQCGRIYTVFLQMPNQEWTLEYCEQKTAPAQPPPQGQSNVIHLETPLTPPDAQARFDFQRIPLSPEKAHKMIVLKGVIREDGTVDQVNVFQGLMPQMDEAARLALSQWRFKPALRQGRPVPLDILVGIPAAVETP